MKNDRQEILNKSIRKVTWPNFIEGALEDELFCYNIGNVLNLTVDRIESSGLFTKNDIFGICDTLILLDSELFYGSKLYSSLSNNKTYDKVIKKLNKTNEVTVNI